MLNKDGQRELAYVVTINDVKPIPGRDRVECAVVNGWTVMVRKNQFKVGDLGIYFEIDSKTPEKEPYEFLAAKHYKIKTQKYALKDENGKKLGQFWSQGLLMSADDFGGTVSDKVLNIYDKQYKEGDFLTQDLGITYAVEEDNARKRNSDPDARINAALRRHPKIAAKYGKFIKKHKFAKWLFLLLFSNKKKDTRSWIAGVPKTDEERIENRPRTLENDQVKWIATEKIDGSSTTFYLSKDKSFFNKGEYLVCSSNVVFDTPTKLDKNFYQDTIGKNIYLEMSEKYNVKEALKTLLDKRPTADWVAIQAETFGPNVQKNDYQLKEREIRAFNLLYSDCGRIGTLEMKKQLDAVNIPVVPIISEGMILPKSIEELRTFVHSEPSAVNGKIKEGIVFRTLDGHDSFKCVDPEYLVMFHS